MKDLKIFARTIEDKALEQIDILLAQEAFKDCKVRIMPDVHAGAGCVIGFTADLGDKVIPNIVGVDIGCGMLTVELGKIDIDYEKLDSTIRARIPSGSNVHGSLVPRKLVERSAALINELHCKDNLRNKAWLEHSMGTLGGGNHFIEIDEDSDGGKYLVIHTGSRNLGKQVADYYQSLAVKRLYSKKEERSEIIERLKQEGRERDIQSELSKLAFKQSSNIPKDLCYLDGTDREGYLDDMRICQLFARFNRESIASRIIDGMGWKHAYRSDNQWFHTVHNYIELETNMVRKGAISAKDGEKVLIPINMRDGCILGSGKGNQDWNYSAPHGAGRIMSRAKAKKQITLEEYRESMADVYTSSVGLGTIDEAPFAYRGLDEILECIGDTVEVQKIIKPVYNFKAAD